MKFNLYAKKYPQEGDLQHTYSPLKNLLEEDNSIVNFNTKELSIDLNNPLNIECQPSYDGTVNLIINDDKNPPRIINSRFTKIEDNRFRIINRNQTEQTNLYKRGEIDLSTRLFRNINKIPKFDFVELNYFGQLKGGNYTFYIKYADSDYNKTDIVCESGQISVFKGNLFDINSISGTLQDERTNKSIKLLLSNIDETFSKFYVYYTREYSDLNGFRMMETVELIKPYEILGDSQEIIINGFEQGNSISSEGLNIKYNYVSNVKTQAQVQNMLFFGNVENVNVDVKNLQNISYFFEVGLHQKEKSIGWIDPNTYQSQNRSIDSLEYYDSKNVYYNLGYWPDEIYRLGVVYIMKDDSLSPVFNLRGCVFPKLSSEDGGVTNISNSTLQYKKWDSVSRKWITNYLERDEFLSSESDLSNTFGVFKNPTQTDTTQIQDYKNKETKPWYYKITIPVVTCSDGTNTKEFDLMSELKELGVKGFFFVRQKRIPLTLCQGVALGIDKESALPVLYDPVTKNYFSESFLNQTNGELNSLFLNRKMFTNNRKGSAIISLDACLVPELQSSLDGSSFLLQRVNTNGTLVQNDRRFSLSFKDNNSMTYRSAKCVFMNSDVPYKYVDGFGFSSRAGSAESTKTFSFFGDSSDKKYEKENRKLARGIYSPYIAVCANLENNAIYNIKTENYSNQFMKDYFGIRRDDNSEFYAISDRFEINDENREKNIYRGDCFTNTVSIRLNRNFTDPDVPVNDTIVDSKTWVDHYGGYFHTTSEDKEDDEEKIKYNWTKINRGDLNAVPLGMWLSYKCMSNYNLGLRAEDRSYTEETALMGNPRSFYPLQDTSTKAANKIEESWILNNGYSATVGRKSNLIAPNIPYIKDLFDNRVMFSNVQVDGDFRNAYRIFQGLSYTDIDRQYGAIVKLIPWGVNLLCVFEHGIGILPINEKALIQTSTEQSIHMYGAGVLQNQISLISPDFGSIWPESIIRTPIGVYGVDTYAKKIWRYTTEKGLETISDMRIQRFLNDNIKLNESDKYPIIGLKNVKTHYNNYKGDVMFTFYNFVEGKEWNLCYNERQSKWITRYSWTPLYSENINNIFYSLDKKRAEVLAHIYDNRNATYGINTTENEWKFVSEQDRTLSNTFETEIKLVGVGLATGFDMTVDSIESSYIKDGVEHKINLDKNFISKYIRVHQTEDESVWKLSWTKEGMRTLLKGKLLSYNVPLYYKVNVTIIPYMKNDSGVKTEFTNTFSRTIGVVVTHEYAPKEYDDLLVNGFYVHGRAGIFNEIRYDDENNTNQIQPTKWYDKQEPFEFEFVVNNEVGLHKIFNNLVIISNNVQPESFEFSITGDVYSLFKNSGKFDKSLKKNLYDSKKGFKNVELEYDPILNNYSLVVHQESKNMDDPKYRRRLGNIQYKEDSWYVTMDPIIFDPKLQADKDSTGVNWSSTKIRDKYLKIRVKYSGEDLVIITALKTLMTLSYS